MVHNEVIIMRLNDFKLYISSDNLLPEGDFATKSGHFYAVLNTGRGRAIFA